MLPIATFGISIVGLIVAIVALITREEGNKPIRYIVGIVGLAMALIFGVMGFSSLQFSPSNIPTSSPQVPAPNTSLPTSIPLPTITPVATTITSSNDARDIAAQTLGYTNLDGLISAFGIPSEIKSRIFVCPKEQTWCLGVYEEPGQADFHFKNATKCTLDGKQANGTSTIPVGFDGMVKGFTIRPCSR